jgi:hypothetical protein
MQHSCCRLFFREARRGGEGRGPGTRPHSTARLRALARVSCLRAGGRSARPGTACRLCGADGY